MYEILAKKIEETPADIIGFNYIAIQNGKEYKSEYKNKDKYKNLKEVNYTHEEIKENFLGHFYNMVWAYVYSLDFLIKNEIKFFNTPLQEDSLFNFMAKIHAQNLIMLQESYLYYYRIREKSLSRICDEKYMHTIDDLKELKKHLINKNKYDEFKEIYKIYREQTLQYSRERIPEEYRLEYMEKSKILYEPEEKKIYARKYKNKRTIWESIFSLYNYYNPKTLKREKILKLFGFKFIVGIKNT